MTFIPVYCNDVEEYAYVMSTPTGGIGPCPNCGENHSPIGGF